MDESDKVPSYEFPYARPERVSKWKSLRLGIWNPKERKFLGRTARSWGGIIFFYICFYIGLAALFAICMQGLSYTIDTHIPKFQLDNSIIGSNPGLGFRPISDKVEEEGSLIWYVASNETSTKYWTDKLDSFLEPYLHKQTLPGGGSNQQVCDYPNPPTASKVCAVDVNNWGPCSAKEGYGYNKSSPCIFLKLNRIFGWIPEYHNDTENLPEDMPEDLKDVIRKSKPKALNTVWLSCKGENPADNENIGPLAYHPTQGFPSFYYPYTNVKGYLSPLVALRLVRPKLNTLINVECRAWAKNINYVSYNANREGSVHFEVMVD